MAAPMRDATAQQPDGGHRPRVADATRSAKPDNFVEYDDNEWDIGIGDLIIDLDADIEKTNEVPSAATMSSATGGGLPASSGGVGSKNKMAIEHSATVDKGLKMKIKRTKPGTKTSEAKHEIVKSNELNGTSAPDSGDKGSKHGSANQSGPGGQNAQGGAGGASGACGPGAVGAGAVVPAGPGVVNNSAKRGSSGHRRDKTRDKHTTAGAVDKQVPNSVKTTGSSGNGAGIVTPALVVTPDVNGVVRATVAPQTGAGAGINAVTPSGAGGGNASGPTAGAAMTAPGSGSTGPSRAVFPASTGPGPPAPGNAPGGGVAAGAGVGQPTSPAKPEQGGKVPAIVLMPSPASTPNTDDRGSPPPKKLKTSVDPKDMVDVCVGTSVGTITEPDCLGPCEPGTSVTLEGIVWHETEGGVLVVNVTWRGKTYVGTLLDCTRHDWAPPRFCDSPTSDLDSRTPKGRGKRGRGNTTTATTPGGDLSNFTETRSSVHSKLRNGGAKGRRGAAAAAAASTGATASTTTTTTSTSAGSAQNSTATTASSATSGTASPTPFVPPRVDNKRKGGSRAGDDDTPPATNTKKSKSTIPASPAITPASGSPPTSPVLLECPEPNCSKKYKHINGLKYHQSHAHGSAAEDDDTKDVTSMSENDESNIEAPSPVTPVKSPEKVIDAPLTPQKKEEPSVVISTPISSVLVPDIPSEPGTPKSRPVTPQPPSILSQPPQEILPNLGQPLVETKSVVKPGVLRYGQTEDYTFANKPPGTPSVPTGASIRTVNPTPPQNNQSESILQNPSLYTNQSSPIQPQINNMQQQIHVMNMGPSTQNVNVQSPGQAAKLPQFKVKPTATLMPDDKKDRNKPPGYKKKNRKSPASSPHPQPELPTYGVDTAGREDVQSPAYSDISDDTAPSLEVEVGDKSKTPSDKKTETGQPLSHTMSQYGMYPFYGQPPYLVPSENKPKDIDKDKPVTDKDGKKDGSEFQQKVLPQHYYSYGYMQGYPYNIEAPYSAVSMVPEDKIKEERLKDSISPVEHNKSIPNSIQVPSTKVKNEPGVKEKHPNENHQIIKESIEMKSQMSSYLYQRPSTQTQQTQNNHNVHHSHSQQQQQQQQREEEIRRYYLYSDQRRKESQGIEQQRTSTTPKTNLQASPGVKHKEKQTEEKKDKEVKQEGVKPTMETQGPPPPPTSQYAYIHPSYMQSPGHYNTIPFDPNHPMYRSMLMHTPYGGNPYLHPQMPRYHAPEDLSRPPQAPAKALDILQHHANQYYTSHKIHELQERAMKSPTPKTSVASTSPSNTGPVTPTQGSGVPAGPLQTQGNQIGPPQGGKQTPGDGKDSRSPPPQRHVHTHHHTHVGLGYPILAGQYPATYGAAVLASQQAAAVTVINPYPPK